MESLLYKWDVYICRVWGHIGSLYQIPNNNEAYGFYDISCMIIITIVVTVLICTGGRSSMLFKGMQIHKNCPQMKSVITTLRC